MRASARIAGTLLAAAVLGVTGACDYNNAKEPAPVGSDALSGAQRRLAELAALAASASYDVTYALAARTGDKGTIRIVAAPPSYRVDVTVGAGKPSTFIDRAGTVVSCTSAAGKPSCFLVARPGEEVPELFDPGVQRLFSGAVADLAANPERYAVRTSSATPTPAAGSECFDVQRVATASVSVSSTPEALPTADPTGFETGRYCFGADGVLTRLEVSTGTLTLTSRGPTPLPTAFDPPATPIALPDLPSASPTR